MKDPDHIESVEPHWQRLRSDAKSIAAEFREEGWETIRFPVGDVSAVAGGDAFGIHLVVPDNKFDELRDLLGDGVAFDSFEIYTHSTDQRVYAIVAATDEETGAAIVYPLYYSKAERDQLAREAAGRGAMVTHLKTLGDDRVTLEQDPDEFFST